VSSHATQGRAEDPFWRVLDTAPRKIVKQDAAAVRGKDEKEFLDVKITVTEVTEALSSVELVTDGGSREWYRSWRNYEFHVFRFEELIGFLRRTFGVDT